MGVWLCVRAPSVLAVYMSDTEALSRDQIRRPRSFTSCLFSHVPSPRITGRCVPPCNPPTCALSEEEVEPKELGAEQLPRPSGSGSFPGAAGGGCPFHSGGHEARGRWLRPQSLRTRPAWPGVPGASCPRAAGGAVAAVCGCGQAAVPRLEIGLAIFTRTSWYFFFFPNAIETEF